MVKLPKIKAEHLIAGATIAGGLITGGLAYATVHKEHETEKIRLRRDELSNMKKKQKR